MKDQKEWYGTLDGTTLYHARSNYVRSIKPWAQRGQAPIVSAPAHQSAIALALGVPSTPVKLSRPSSPSSSKSTCE